MASTYSALKIELIGTGEQSGTWGTTTNTNLGDAALGEAITGSADVAFSSADVTVTLTDSNASQTARNLRLNLTGTTGGARSLILGSNCQIEKFYLINNTCADAITVKNTTGTGIAVPAGKATLVYNNGTNVVDAATYFSSLTLGSALPVASGGTGATTAPAANANIQTYTTTVTAAGTTTLTNASTYYQYFTGSTTQTVVLPVASTLSLGWSFHIANNSSGNLSLQSSGLNAVATILPNTTAHVTCILASGTDAASWDYGFTDFNTTVPIALGGTGATTLAGANIAVTTAANSFTAKQTFTGATASLASAFINATETSTISATAATGTINYDVTTQSVLYYTTSASANWTLNIRGNGTTSLNTLMSTNDSLTVVFLVTQGATAYYNNAVTIDGSSVTPKYQGGTAWSSGNASGIDAYSYTIVKTGSAAFTVFAAQTQFK